MKKVTAETNFQAEREIFRGFIYDRKKVGSLIYKGVWQGKPAVLKLQGLRPEIDESEIIKHFTAQNHSKIIRVPTLYAHKPWTANCGYGYLITEFIDAPKIFEMPFAAERQMHDFANFYQEYRTSALTQSWIEPDTNDTLQLTFRRVDSWRKISEYKKRLRLDDYASYLIKYYPIALKHLPTIPLVFCHGHLTADDIYRLPDGSYVVLSNLFWSYRPEWYDLAFNIWACLMHIRDTNYTFKKMLDYVDKWLTAYRRIPIVKKDKDFEHKITVALLERTIGAILVDLGTDDFYGKKENVKYYKHLLNLHQRLFNCLTDRLENFK